MGHVVTDLETFLLDTGFDRTFRMLEKRTPGDWTPLEMAEKYVDQDHYVSSSYTHIRIEEAIELPDKDVLIGYRAIHEREDLDAEAYRRLPIHYRKLSRIELSFFPEDMEEDEEDW